LDQGAAVNLQTHQGRTALMCASTEGSREIVALLLEQGAAVDLQTPQGQTALMCAAEKGRRDVVALLLDQGAAVNQATTTGLTALMMAADEGHVGVVSSLLQRGAAPNMIANDGRTALMCAACTGHRKLTELLAKKIATTNQAQCSNTTDLISTQSRWLTMLALLLDHGAAVDRVDNNGRTILTWATVRRHTEVGALLAQAQTPWTPGAAGQLRLMRPIIKCRAIAVFLCLRRCSRLSQFIINMILSHCRLT